MIAVSTIALLCFFESFSFFFVERLPIILLDSFGARLFFFFLRSSSDEELDSLELEEELVDELEEELDEELEFEGVGGDFLDLFLL